MNKLPFTHFDLPRQHLSEQGHYIPARTRDPDEIVWRKRVPAGTVLADQQAKGLRVAGQVLARVEEESLSYSADMISKAALNTGWYTFAQGAPNVMRRRLYLPKLADHESEWRQSMDQLRTETLTNVETLASFAGGLVLRSEAARPSQRVTTQFGRLAGTTALQLAVIRNGSLPAGNAFEVQKQARDIALETLDASRGYNHRIGAHISIAQLADPDSPLSVEWRRSAPDQAYEALEQAQEALSVKLFSR